MPKILIFLSIFIPTLLIATGLTIASVALRSLMESSQALECFCPSCPATAFSEKGAAVLGLVKVDIQGAVKKPGIYQLEIGQRVADLLALAGGFAKDADQAYVAKTLNLSTELKNQDKIYIPFFEENRAASSSVAQNLSDSNSSNSSLVSINQADSAKLQSLAGIGEVRAQAVIDNRPYANLEELVSKDVLSESVFSGLKAQLSL